jgi:DNA primase
LHQANAGNAIATCGTSLTEGHAKLLHRFCKHVILFRDGDKAGLRAVHRDIDICLRFGFKVEVVICPDGEDPDSLSKQCDVNDFIEKNREGPY